MTKRGFLILLLAISLSSCSTSDVQYILNLPQGQSEGYLFYKGLTKSYSNGSGLSYLVEFIDFDGDRYDLTSHSTQNTFFTLPENELLVVGACKDIGKSLIFKYRYLFGDYSILASFENTFLSVDLLSGGAISISDDQTSFIFEGGNTYSLPGRVLWLGKDYALTVPPHSSSSDYNYNVFTLYERSNGAFQEKGDIQKPTGNWPPIVVNSDALSNECVIKNDDYSSKFYRFNASDFEKGFVEDQTTNYIKTYSGKLNIAYRGLSNGSTTPVDYYETSTYAINDEGLIIHWQNGVEEAISLTKYDESVPEVVYLKEADLLQIKYDYKHIFTYSRKNKELSQSGCLFNVCPMSSRYTLWENDSYRFVVQNHTYKRLGPGDHARESYLLRENKTTGAVERMRELSLGFFVDYCYPYSFDYVDTSAE